MDTPKCACTTIKWLIAHVEGFQPAPIWMDGEARLEMCIHNRAFHPLPSILQVDEKTADRALFSGDYFRFCVVRNPYWRLVSSWMSKIRQGDPLFAWATAAAQKYSGRQTDEPPGFRDFANWVLATNEPRSCNVHWRPQTRLLRPKDIPYDMVLKTETLSDQLVALFNRVESLSEFDAAALLKRYNYNESLPLVDEPLYDEALAAGIYEFYKEDFETYGYARDSWTEPRIGKAPAQRVEAAALDHIRHSHQLMQMAWVRMTEQSKQLNAANCECESLRRELSAAKDEAARLSRERAALEGEIRDITAQRDAMEVRIDPIPLAVQRIFSGLQRLATSIRRPWPEPRNTARPPR